MYKLFLFIGFFYCLTIQATTAQDSVTDASTKEVRYDVDSQVQPPNFNQETIEDFKADDDFDYTEVEAGENWYTKFKRWLNRMWHRFWQWLIGDYEASPFWSVVIQMLPYIIVAGIVGFIAWLFYKLNPGAKMLRSQNTPEVFFTEEEEIIKSKDIQKLIAKALEAKDYRLAVRYYYLFILKRLTNAEFIDYEFDKTNSDYSKELSEKKVASDFNKATNLYDYIWYGNFEVTAEDYKKAERTFRHLETQIPEAIA